MEKSATLNLRVNPTLKQNAESVLGRLGIPLSTAVDMFLNQIVLVGGIPFSVTLPIYQPEYIVQLIAAKLIDTPRTIASSDFTGNNNAAGNSTHICQNI